MLAPYETGGVWAPYYDIRTGIAGYRVPADVETMEMVCSGRAVAIGDDHPFDVSYTSELVYYAGSGVWADGDTIPKFNWDAVGNLTCEVSARDASNAELALYKVWFPSETPFKVKGVRNDVKPALPHNKPQPHLLLGGAAVCCESIAVTT